MKSRAEETREQLSAIIRRQIDDMAGKHFMAAFGTTTNNAPASGTSFDQAALDRLVREADRMKAAALRNQVLIQVEEGHIGPILSHKSATTGTIYECSYEQALQVHRLHPLVLHQVVASDIAIFRPAHGLDMFVPMGLPRPPYEMPVQRGLPD
jgi:hypothetical protein